MYLEQLQYGLWALAVVGQIIASALLYKRGLSRLFRAFFVSTIFETLRSVALYAILWFLNNHMIPYRFYFLSYWITDALSVGLCLLVIHEVFRNFFNQYQFAGQIAAFALSIAVVVLLCANLFLVRGIPGHESHRLISSILLLDRSVAVVQIGLLLVLFLCSQLMALPWRTDLSFGIGLGLGLVGAINVIADSARAHYGRMLNDIYATAKVFAYLLAVVIWLVYIFAPRIKTNFNEGPACESPDLEEWNRTLKELVNE